MNQISREQVAQFVVQMIGHIEQNSELDKIINFSFAELEFDEIDLTYLIVESEERYEILLDDMQVAKCQNVEQIIQYIYDQALLAQMTDSSEKVLL